MVVGLYLVAIVAANLLVATFGPSVSILNAFLFIGLDLSARDRLHTQWQNNGLVWKMAALIAAGGAISFLLNRDAGPIALASTVAFGAAAVVDAVIYHILRRKPFMFKANASNVPAALVDSLVFPTLAFGGIMPLITLGQFVAKVAGGFVWSLILRKRATVVATSQ